MDNNKSYNCVEKNERVYAKNLDMEEDFSEALPAYCDDIYRVVKCNSHSHICSVSISESNVIIMGKTEITLTYYNENASLCYADFEEDFSKTVAAENLSDSAFALSKICDRYTNFRVINQRRIDVHSSSVIYLSVYDSVKYPVLCSCNGAKLRECNTEAADIIGSDISRLEFDEEFSVPSGSEPIKRIVSSSCNAYVTETKIIKDKVLVKGSVRARILYTSDTDNEAVLSFENTFNVSRIIDKNGIEDNDIIICEMYVGNLFHKAKSSVGDKLSEVEIFGDIIINSVFIRSRECNYITDGYMLKRASSCSYTDLSLMAEGRYISEEKTLNIGLDFSNDIKEIKDISITVSPFSVRNSKLSARAGVSLLYENESEALSSMSASADISLDSCGREYSYSALNIISYDFTIASSKHIDLRLNARLSLFLYNSSMLKVLSEIEEGEEKSEPSSITLYYAKEKENVWDIAKSFSSDSDMIISENELSGETLESSKVLIIPRAQEEK